ncbi:NAD-dependent glycerol-3-phosphate dehydrogenase family protein [Neorickettsia helminthoeca str. Oregon]|uniref:Glycerol-3-phosphate dehydrogenase n=1 Tax=Neorickettsia helminthoeca str. Oregon TaxID=1286528 RepID=X5HJC6_9RICK|nr:NAD(P)H-dependent glycerol-3-phosphate dehydrogenase [Neorickettsia helminthoeca]AHX11174.1 NAD-dependent glycerol-3-phosphate dehydrogenase family protein [Neorickettsia helminthoeca str. Oregon]
MQSVVIGGGAWGTAIANLLASNSPKVHILSRNHKIIDSINNSHTNPVYFDGFQLNQGIIATNDPAILTQAESVFIAIPSQSTRAVLKEIKKNIKKDAQIILCNKGIEKGSMMLISEVVQDEIKNNIFFLSGPNFAHEVIAEKYSFANLASADSEKYKELSEAISTRTFFTKYIKDINGAQVIAAFKNAVAILCGLLVRLGSEFNTLAALVSIALTEVKGFVEVKNGDPNTITEFCGIGDLVLTCFSDKSRNFKFGYELIDGKENNTLVEGRATLESLYELAKKHDINCILINTLHDIITSRTKNLTSLKDEVRNKLDLAFNQILRHY